MRPADGGQTQNDLVSGHVRTCSRRRLPGRGEGADVPVAQAGIFGSSRLGDVLIEQIAAECGQPGSVVRMRRKHAERKLIAALQRGNSPYRAGPGSHRVNRCRVPPKDMCVSGQSGWPLTGGPGGSPFGQHIG